MKKSFTILLSIFLVLILATCWFALEIRAKMKYDQAKQENDVAYSVTLMDQNTTAFLEEVQSNWTCWSDHTNGPDSEALKLIGKTPLVRNLIEMYNFRMPPFRWLSPSQNREAVAVNLVKSKFMPVPFDKVWHVSADEHMAFLLYKSNGVALYRDEPSGLRASYFKSGKKP